jgi:hypothetical protein
MQSYVEYLWTFDSTYQDLSSIFNAIPMNGAGFSSSTITGYGSSLSLSSALNQWVQMNAPFLNLSDHSWTFEAWIYPSTLINSVYYPIVGQCDSLNNDQCLHLVIRSPEMYMGFFSDDLAGVTSLVSLKWYHVAYVFDSANVNQSVYLNGVLDGSRTANSYYRGNSGSLTVGMALLPPVTCYFDGLIDQLSYTNRAKSSTEILDDATLTLYFSFDNGPIYDSGPLRINGSLFGSTSIVAGRIGDALQFGSSTNSYFGVSGLVLLGISNQPYSMSIWIKPTVINTSSIIYVSSDSNGSGWCLGMLSMSSSGQLITTSYDGALVSIVGSNLTLNNWTHAAITYSTVNGLRLYIDGNLLNSTLPFSYAASGVQNYLFLASSLNQTTCGGQLGQFFGALDEFRLYSRELSASDVWSLFNA